jgi:hypothetical protein
MAIALTIRDGSPDWYLSTDIWVVPGNDPAGLPGSPQAGHPAYLWAHVQNAGTTDASGVRVDFYWANPALQVTRSNAHLVGSAFADVAAGAGQDVLCLVSWTPVIVNGGHECLIGVANHPGDPLPLPLPDAFDPPTYRQVAQRNLTVLPVGAGAAMILLTIAAPVRVDQSVTISAEVGGRLHPMALASLGLEPLHPAKDRVVEVGLQRRSRCFGQDELLGETELEMRVARGTSAPVYAAIRSRGLSYGQYQVVRIMERDGDRVLGGIAFVVVASHEEER